MYEPKDYYESQDMFVNWRNGTKFVGSCNYQIYGECVLIEKWSSYDGSYVFIVEFYPNGQGFNIYD